MTIITISKRDTVYRKELNRMAKHELTKESFLKCVENHKAEIIKDDGLYRHIHCSKGSLNQHFDIITYPNHLVISGDMGDFLFQRTEDMFNFFRPNGEYWEDKWVNLGYWSEKLQAVSSMNGYKEFSEECVKQSIKDRVNDYCEDIEDYYEEYVNSHGDYEPEHESVEEFEAAFRAEIDDYFEYKDMDQYRFVSAIEDFSSDIIDDCSVFEDLGDWLYEFVPTYHYQWCCYAIVWAIKQYDELKANQ